MARFRRFRNDDVPALMELWNLGTPESAVARPLQPRELGAAVFDHPLFEPGDLLVALEGDRSVGFAHVGFGPVDPAGPPLRLDRRLGTIAMLAVHPDAEPGLEAELARHAVDRLRERGAGVVYAGGRYPVNPFYWGLYGGSEFSGILDHHERFHAAVRRLGFRPSARTVLMQIDFERAADPPLDPRSIRLRRRFRTMIVEDAVPERWWDGLAVGARCPILFRLEDRDGRAVARATSWDMLGYERTDGRLKAGVVDVEVSPEHRRLGLGRLLMAEVLRALRGRRVHVACVQTAETNEPARSLYRSLGFEDVGGATFYRLDGP